MTSIDRDRFVRDLSSLRLSLSQPSPEVSRALEGLGITAAELRPIAGADEVIHGRAEYEQLYDRLVALEAKPQAREARLDGPQALYQALRGAGTSAPAPAPSGRTTGVLAPGRPVVGPSPLEVVVRMTPSERAESIGNSAISALEAGARRNALGPEARAQVQIRGQTEHTVEVLRGLQARAAASPAGSDERQALEQAMDAQLRLYANTVSAEVMRATGGAGGGAGNPMDSVVRALPPFLRESVRREGLALPGVPGALAPRFSGTPGLDWKLKF